MHRYQQAQTFLSEQDPDFAKLIAEIGDCQLILKSERDPYEALVRAVAYQQLSTKAGDAILAKFKAHFGGEFPTPEQLAHAEFDALRACGFSGRKAETTKGIAQGALTGLVPTLAQAEHMRDEDLIERLVALKGIGRWTVEMMLIFTLQRPDILPVDDFGVREGYKRLKSLTDAPTPKALAEIGLAWQPYRTVASWYLWRVPK
ncbi:HhH-GPD superfamily base excision DNA repair protein [Methylophilaceae bacterium 11]|nr:HhH-GPD superfamily base excision DNA repair protein [Methylophilaceae bacterium 11]